MTGRDLIVYILENNLEDAQVFEDGKLLGFLSISEFALKLGVGTATVDTWFKMGLIKGFKIGEEVYIPANTEISINKGDIRYGADRNTDDIT